MQFLDRLRDTRRNNPSKTAIDFRGRAARQLLSYEALHAGSARAAAWLARQGVRPGDRVATCLPKSVAAIQLHLATCGMGAVSMPLNPACSPSEIEYLLRDSEARLLVTELGSELVTATGRGHSSALAKVIAIESSRFDEQLEGPGLNLSQVEISPSQTALMLYTSGTTGRPKGACMSHASLTANMDMLDEAWQWSSDDVLLHALPMFHLHGLLVALHGALHAGAASVVLPSFDAQTVLAILRGGECTVFMAVPTMYRRILRALGDAPTSLEGVRLLTSGSDRLPVDTFLRIERQLGMRAVERYGMTETGIMLSNPIDGERVAGQVGVPLPGVEMRIVGPETGLLARTGEVGELQTRGPHVFKGYWRDPDKTRRAFADDGWFSTGDLGLRDRDGRYELKGRSTDLIISGGFNVYPSEVERALSAHPDVDQCAVVGLPDEEWGECVTAFVVTRSASLDGSELVARGRRSLAAYKVPKRVVFVDALPRNAMGKVQKKALRDGSWPSASD